jgi:hypothetical protein
MHQKFDMAHIIYPLEGFQFMATPALNAFFVIQNGSSSTLPIIVAEYRLDRTDNPGLSLELTLDADGTEGIRLTEGNIFRGNLSLEMISAGSVRIETASYKEGNALVRLNAYFNGAMVDNKNRSVTVAGIGISDILATDPLVVGLVNAPLSTIPYYAHADAEPVNRLVKGIFLDYQPMAFNPLTGMVPGSVVHVQIAAVVAAP